MRVFIQQNIFLRVCVNMCATLTDEAVGYQIMAYELHKHVVHPLPLTQDGARWASWHRTRQLVYYGEFLLRSHCMFDMIAIVLVAIVIAIDVLRLLYEC